MTDQLPAIIEHDALANPNDTYIARVQPVFRVVRKARALADDHSAVRRGGLGERPAAETRGAGGQAAARGRAHTTAL